MKFNLVALEETQYWNPEIIQKTGRIFTAYAYTPDEATHCCEITPSYYLIPVDFFTEKEIDDEFQGELLGDWRAATEPCYVHCSSIDRMPEKIDGFLVKHEDANDFEDEEEAIDYFGGNSFLG